ncbi:hypothetical protein B0O80DRAFT_437261 [Mortierella sp. GBAus27b]|nr:hypothetical protein BGX31_004661 [Mortierella sp. GBA43]KAI8361308.1 hypothetical protein B0O80DRAFT_437261 [Mortierella sp. GBAus27b]
MAFLLDHADDIVANNDMPDVAPSNYDDIEPFLDLTRDQSRLLLSLYRVVHPELEPKVPILYSEMSRKLNEDRKERNSRTSKLERASEVYTQEVLLLQDVQKAVIQALSDSEMDISKARIALELKPQEAPMDQLSNRELLMSGFLLGGVRANTGDKKSSPLSAPGFRESKSFYDYLLNERKFSMAGVQMGGFYAQEFKDAKGENCQEGEDPEQISIEYFEKAAALGNPMGMHKAGWHYDQRGKFDKAIELYTQAADEGFPDSAHNLGRIYQEGNPHVKLEIDLPQSIKYYSRALQYGYAPSGTQLGRIFFLLHKDKSYRDNLPSSDPNHSTDPREYLETAISYFDQANQLLDAESMQFLGMIYGSKEFGRYDLDRAQNLFELALIISRGSQQSFDYLCRALNAKKAIFEQTGTSTAAPFSGTGEPAQKIDGQGLKTCAARSCDKKETTKNQFQRCGGCKKRFYCSRECQVEDWKKGHKSVCNKS